MSNSFTNIVQKCICIDFILNTLINSNSYEYLSLLSSMKDENLQNIKVICHIYEYIYKENLLLENASNIRLNKYYENNLDELIEYNLNIITELEYLKHHPLNHNYFNLLQNLINSYFNFISLINCLYTSRSPDIQTPLENNNAFFNLKNSLTIKYYHSPLPIDLIRKVSIEAINFFFNYSLIDNLIDDEYYEIFLKNSPENKFYQFCFKSFGNIFKVRILDSKSNVFYISRSYNNPIKIVNTLSKDNAKNLVDSYLLSKFESNYANLSFDRDYVKISYYNKLPNAYKFKYIYKYSDIKSILNKTLYITINAHSCNIQEISSF